MTALNAPPAAMAALGLQPFLHDRIFTVSAPSIAISGPDGQLSGAGADGLFHDDRRVLSRLLMSVPGALLAPIQAELKADGSASFLAVVRGVGEHSADPAVTLARHRSLHEGRFEERLVVSNGGEQSVRLTLEVELGSDMASVAEVKGGGGRQLIAARLDGDALTWPAADCSLTASLEGATPSSDGDRALLSAEIVLESGQCWERLLSVVISAAPALFPAPAPAFSWPRAAVRSADPRLDSLFGRAVCDLGSLLLCDPESSAEDPDVFMAAGAPWFLTLFGRDSLWAASMLLPLSTEIAGGTLRTLARRQGQVVDDLTGEAPGKVIHEVRRGGGDEQLPPLYYGTIDATPLWLTLLHDAWRWGMDPAAVEQLLDPAEAALRWLRDYGDADGDGLLEYVDVGGRGLANQGWRDSSDSIRWHDGRLAAPPLALAEVQGYAYRAANVGADLLDAFGRAGADEWRAWALRLKTRFDQSFWLEGDLGPYPAVALDGEKRPADSLTSALGHLLGTGLLDAAHEQSVARYLHAPELDSGLGLRTLSTRAVGFNPLGYHTGSIWPHDTAIAACGLARAGYPDAAWSLLDGLLRAGDAFDFRLPELFAGHGRKDGRPAPYPAACRPQAWSAAAAVAMLRTILGIEADVPGGQLRVSPMAGPSWPLSVEGLKLAGQPLSVRVDRSGAAEVQAARQLTVVVGRH